MNKETNPNPSNIKHKSSRFAQAIQSFRKKFPTGFKVLRIGLWLFIFSLLLLVGFGASVYFGAFGKLPTKEDLKKINTRVASEVYSADGKIIGKFYLENRIFVDIDSISPHVIHALVATEDERFFKHKGVDFRSLSRVLFKTILTSSLHL